MKFSLRAANYTVTPASSQIVFGGVSNFDIRGLMYVGNATAKVDIYVAGDPNLPFASVSGTTVTFATPMTAMSASDVYVIIYDDSQIIQPVSGTVSAAQSGAWSFSLSGTAAVTQSGSWTVAVSNAFALDATITARLNTLGQKTGANSAPVVIASDQSAVPVSGTVNAVQSGAWSVSVTGTVAVTQSGAWTVAVSNNFALDATLTARLGTLGQKTGSASTPVVIASDQSAVPALAVATAAANAVLQGRVTSAASINATSLKTSAGNLVEIDVYNVATALRYLRIFNKASAPAPGSDGALLIWEIPIPAGGGFTWTPPIPLSLSTGISYVITAGAGGTDTTNTAANDVVGIIRYL